MPSSRLTVLPSKARAKLPSFDNSSESPTERDYASDKVAVEDDSNDDDVRSESFIIEENDAFFNDLEPDLFIQSTKKRIAIPVPPLISPKSSYIGWEPPMKISVEEDVLRELICDDVRDNASFGGEKFTSLKLDQFVIYRPSSGEGRGSDAEFAALQDLCVRRANSCYLFDGILSLEREGENPIRRYVEKIPFENLSVGGYGNRYIYNVENTIWIQSKVGTKNGVWYQLCHPAKEYDRFYEPFVWIATFAKHFLAFVNDVDSDDLGVTLRMFKSNFWKWVNNLEPNNAVIQAWAAKYSDTDFRRVVTAHCTFLRNEARQIYPEFLEHPIWSEIDPQALTAIPTQPMVSDSNATIVTPYVYECFNTMAWQKFMTPVDPHDCPPGQFTTFARHSHEVFNGWRPSVRAGEVVKLQRDQSGPWKTLDDIWLAYVTDVVNMNGKMGLRILWLYRPADTICSNMQYPFQHPFKNELFLSDYCACDQPLIPEDSILGKARVAFWGSPTSATQFFVRQRYSDEAFESLKEDHLQCNCMKQRPFQYQIGQTVLVNYGPVDQPTIEVVELRSNPFGHNFIKARHLVRRREIENGTTEFPRNELVYTGRLITFDLQDIIRPCHIRPHTPDEQQRDFIPPPYSRDGTGDAFFITHEEVAVRCGLYEVQPLQKPFPKWMLQSFVPPSIYLKRLRTLDLFCGGGNFGRGIEEGGVATVKWAVDIDKTALHTYRANLEHPDQAHLFLGSVNDYLRSALEGNHNPLIPRKGEVDMILAGSPCQGYSLANRHSSNDQGLQHQSMIASVASFVDFYRPKYLILENVKNISATGKKNAGKNVFSQMICCLVGMGYQVHQFCVDAWSVGSPQQRTRLFIAATAPGFVPLRSPPVTHAHPARISTSSIGETANGLKFGARDLDVKLLFPYMAIGAATVDIDYSFDGRATSIKFPDHRLTRNANTNDRLRTSHIPRNIPKAGLGMAVRAGLVPQPLVESITPKLQEKLKHKSCASFQRNHAEALIPTVITHCAPMDQYTGRLLHWECDRALTVLEVRRAQGFPDREVIIGTPTQQWKVVGNSVARPVALALGMSLRKAWLEYNFPDGFPEFHLRNAIEYNQPEDPAPNGYGLTIVTHKFATIPTD